MGFGLKVYTLEQRIEEAELCVARQMWQAALALALTIPDICGQIKYIDLKMLNKKMKLVPASQGCKYSTWFHEYIEHYFADDKGWNDDGFAINPYFTGDMCYQLRCAFLHSGDDTNKKTNEKTRTKFTLRINASDSVCLNIDDKIQHINIDIEKLCNDICKGATCFCRQWENPQDFEARKCEWLDLKEWSNCVRNNNIKGQNYK